MPRTTHILQPIIYDMMILAQALKDLNEFGQYKPRDALFPKRECALTSACTKIRTLAEFWGGTTPTGKNQKGTDVVTVADASLNWTPDTSFYAACWGPVSDYVDHPLKTRSTKQTKRPTVHFAHLWGTKLLRKTQQEIDHQMRLEEITLTGDARIWYDRFNQLFTDYLALPTGQL